MEQLILHLLGDYLLQTDWMAQNKKVKTWRGELACQVHCLLYSIPFLLIGTWQQVLFIYVTHYLIDRFGFVKWYMTTFDMKEFMKPPLGPWSIFITDNTFHLICNYIALTWVLF